MPRRNKPVAFTLHSSIAIALALQLLSGCSGSPSFILGGGDKTKDAPVGPKVASLVANLKCELWEAAQSNNILDYYNNDPSLTLKNPPGKQVEPGREFTLHNIFEEIEYVASAQFTLDVTNTGAINPTESFTEFFKPAKGLMPVTSLVLSVGGQYSEAAHRQISIELSVDFSRLVASEPNPKFKEIGHVTPVARVIPRPEACDAGTELGGQLGLKEALAAGMTALAMNDIGVFPEAGGAIAGATPAVALPSSYSFGQISTQIDFMINENVNGGPTWNLRHFKGPNGSPGLLI